MVKKIRMKKMEPSLRMLGEEYLMDCQARGLVGEHTLDFEKAFKFAMAYINPDLPVSEVNYKAFYSNLYKRDDLSPNTIACYLKKWKVFIRWVNKTYVMELPVPVIKSVESVKIPYTDEELKKLIARPKKWSGFCEYRNWLIVNFLIDTGIRASTLRNILIKDMDFERNCFVTRHNKTKKIQILPYNKSLTKDLIAFIKMRDYNEDDYLFCNQFGQQLDEGCLKMAIRGYNLSRGVTKTSIHLFRHTFARKYLVDCNGDALKLQRLLGHSTLQMTQNYVRLYSQDLLDEAKSPLATLQSQRHKVKF